MSAQAELFDLKVERRKRDAALDLLDKRRAELIARAHQIATYFCRENGTVTSPQVIAELKKEGAPGLDEVDPRFMGAVFRAGRGWRRIGYRAAGSHARPVSVWTFSTTTPSR